MRPLDLHISRSLMPKSRKRVLIITYYWPPSGGSGVQRWVKFVKYLRDYDWEPIIYTPSNPEFPEIDHTLEKDIPGDIEIITTPIWEPYTFYKKFVGLKRDTKLKTGIINKRNSTSLTSRISLWIRGNLFIPDARKFWIKPSISFLSSYLKNKNVDAIVTNGTPHSLHLIGLELKKKFNLPWLADFRDPWTNIDFYSELMLTSWADKKHHKLEKEVITTADCVTVTTPGTKSDFLADYPDSNIEVITNGFDPEDFEDIDIQLDNKFVIAHIGVLTPSRNHPFFWDAIEELVAEHKDFAKHFILRLIGDVDPSILQEIDNRKLASYVEHIDHLPHSEIPKALRKAWVLLLKIRNAQNQQTIIPGKIFEYLASRRPVISIGPVDSDSARILKTSNAGKTFSEGNKLDLKIEILRQFDAYQEGKIEQNAAEGLNSYSRDSLTKKMASLLDSIT